MKSGVPRKGCPPMGNSPKTISDFLFLFLYFLCNVPSLHCTILFWDKQNKTKLFCLFSLHLRYYSCTNKRIPLKFCAFAFIPIYIIICMHFECHIDCIGDDCIIYSGFINSRGGAFFSFFSHFLFFYLFYLFLLWSRGREEGITLLSLYISKTLLFYKVCPGGGRSIKKKTASCSKKGEKKVCSPLDLI